MKRKKEKKENSERWLLTYSDLITLLMILFVVMYSMSTVDQNKYEQLASSLNKSLGSGLGTGSESILPGGAGVIDGGILETQAVVENNTQATTQANNATQATTSTGEQLAEQAQMRYVKEQLEDIITKEKLGGDIGVNIQESGLVITFPSNTFFDSGKAELKENMKLALVKISKELNMIDNSILVKGYTDNRPISNSTYASNWQLSGARALNVVQYLVDNCSVDGNRLSGIGLGANNPVATNDTVEGQTMNRRIEISIPYTYKQVIK